MTDAITVYSIPVILWAAVAYKLYPHVRWKRKPNASQRELVITLACLGLGAVLLLPPAYRWLGGSTGIPNIARLLANGLGLVACWTGQALFVRLIESEGRARRIIRLYALALLVLLALLAAFFVAASPSLTESAIDFTQRFADNPYILAYRVVVAIAGTALFSALVEMVLTGWRTGRRLDAAGLAKSP